MTMELVTGHAGTAHVSGADVGAFNAGTIGDGTYILASSLPVLSMLDANTLEVPVCEILAEGRHVRIKAAENVTIESGSQTGYRNDIVYLRYNLDSGTGEETATLVVAKGTTVASQSDVVDPTTAYSSASILNGASTVDIALVRVSLAGLTPTPEWVVGNWIPGDARAVVLYDNAAGTNNTITLSESAADFEYIEIYYGKLDGTSGGYAYTRVYNPDGKRVVFQQVNTPPYNVQIITSKILINANSVTWDVRGMTLTYNVQTSAWSYGGEENRQLIYRVVGYR